MAYDCEITNVNRLVFFHKAEESISPEMLPICEAALTPKEFRERVLNRKTIHKLVLRMATSSRFLATDGEDNSTIEGESQYGRAAYGRKPQKIHTIPSEMVIPLIEAGG